MAAASAPPPLLTVLETAVALRVSDDTVYRLIAAGDLESTDVAPTGSRRPKTRVLAKSVNEFIASRTRNARGLRSVRSA